MADFVRAVRDVGVEDVGQGLQDALDRVVLGGGLLLQAVHVVAQRGRLGFQRRGIGAGTLALPDLAGQRVAPRLLLLQRCQRGAALGVQGEELRRHRRQSPPRKRGIEAGWVGTDGADVMHRSVSSPSPCGRGLGGGSTGGVARPPPPNPLPQGEGEPASSNSVFHHHTSTGFGSTIVAAMMEIS